MKVEDLRKMTKDELIGAHDSMMQNRAEHYNIFLDELVRREAVEQGQRMESLTVSINRLTWVVTIATIVGVMLSLVSLLF